jgi:glycosyltransferase involved in cell wall biosynthesis
MNVCALIPIYNQETTITSVVEKTHAFISSVVVIDDGSSDDSARMAEKSGAYVLKNPANQGKGAALKKGFDYALKNGYDAVITLDGDGQHAPEEIPRFLHMCTSSDILLGTRMLTPHSMPFFMMVTNRIMSVFISLLAGVKITDSQSGFRLIRASVLKKISLHTNHYEMESEQLLKASRHGFRIKEIPITTIYLKTTFRKTLIKDTFRFIRLILTPSLYAKHQPST